MEQGGVMYWSELYPNVGILDGSDKRNVLIPAVIKYGLIDRVFHPMGKILGFEVTAWEEYDIDAHDLPILRSALESIRGDEELYAWAVSAIEFIDEAIDFNRNISIAL